MDRDHFYITLYSNASQEIYPDNKIGAFKIQLTQPVKLAPSEIWEVGFANSPTQRSISDLWRM